MCTHLRYTYTVPLQTYLVSFKAFLALYILEAELTDVDDGLCC